MNEFDYEDGCIGRVEIPARRETLPLLQGAA